MGEVLDCDLAKEIVSILPYLDCNYTSKISDDLFSTLIKLAADSQKDFYIKKDMDLKEQELSEECKNFISLLYFQGLDKISQDDLVKQWLMNDADN